MVVISNAREAIKLAKAVIDEAGYDIARIADVSYDDDEETWEITAYSGDTIITLLVDNDGNVNKFETEE